MYAQGRTKKGNIVTNAKGSDYSSQHQWGIAFDIALKYDVDGDGRITDDTYNNKGIKKLLKLPSQRKLVLPGVVTGLAL